MRARVAALFSGAGLFVGVAAVLFLFALIVVFLEFQSPDLVLWTGQRVVGTEQGGIVSYQWHGQAYSLDARGFGSSRAVNVYLDPGNPGNAMIDATTNRVLLVSLVGGPLAGGVALLVVGLTRNYRWTRRQLRGAARQGLDPDWVDRQLQELRRDHRNPQ